MPICIKTMYEIPTKYKLKKGRLEYFQVLIFLMLFPTYLVKNLI